MASDPAAWQETNDAYLAAVMKSEIARMGRIIKGAGIRED